MIPRKEPVSVATVSLPSATRGRGKRMKVRLG